MRLLTHRGDDRFILENFDGDSPPAYAILSHTWCEESEQEVTFHNIETNQVADELGCAKLQFCAKQAAADGLCYFWIDTCCINKSSDAELSEAINSMFRWYQHATKCYVYLADVSANRSGGSQELMRNLWEPALRQSRWFTRGWTLQELLALHVVEFYTYDSKLLGDKSSLQQLICNVARTNREALHSYNLINYGLKEKISWAADRNTRREEDKIYSLLGIFNVSMLIFCREGQEKALRRLRREY